MNNHSHPITNLALAFAFGVTVAIMAAALTHGGFVYQENVSKYVVLDASTDGEKHTCGYITEDGVTENLDAYAERCPEDVEISVKSPERQQSPLRGPVGSSPRSLRVSKIGGTPVPYGLNCEEDEVIYFTGPDTLDCVHVDTLAGG